LLFTGKTKIYIQKKEKTLNSKLKFDISISDEPPFIIAFVVISLAPNV
jgi:phosphopantetheinyl transferase (holo-ACP synthase)